MTSTNDPAGTRGGEARDVTTSFARVLVDEWARGGVTDAVISPGSRSAPIALALAADARIRIHVHQDERSAAFIALGIGRATNRPAVVLCTSGTAAANFHPAVLEAFHGGVPLIVATADRPPTKRGTGAPQTINQVGLYGDAVRWSVDSPPPTDVEGAEDSWRELGATSVIASISPIAGPVHLNLCFDEPLVPTGARLIDGGVRGNDEPWLSPTQEPESLEADQEEIVSAIAKEISAHQRGVIIVGWGSELRATSLNALARATGWPVLADPISNLRGTENEVVAYDALLRDQIFASAYLPTLALRFGALPSGRVLGEWLARVERVLAVDPAGRWIDPARTNTEVLIANAEASILAITTQVGQQRPSLSWLSLWRESDALASAALKTVLDSTEVLSDSRIARDVVSTMPPSSSLLVASSMPVRDVESFAPARSDISILANRGVNGIDGFVSTAIGYAIGSQSPTVALVGDLCFLHDTNALLGAAQREVDLVIVIVDNQGGAIFSFLPQAQIPESFETLFGTPHSVDIALLCAAHGVSATEVGLPEEVAPALARAIADGGLSVVLLRTDRDANVAHHREAWSAVSSALSEGMR
ncbi:MAG: 2-succinyl-5-enolpyruvyl-6-hydroxy-3-cyclohexene-1-carboxylic-acid synthase [Acidimicrobiia bacterium]|nr:2-succinyl-5-enolpyruvyl-6-hydroxy-3-cyclohexene-1-carboxylic-acid synthase [Acidimicrobiia bacterium]